MVAAKQLVQINVSHGTNLGSTVYFTENFEVSIFSFLAQMTKSAELVK
jgi:hypothetical protein